MNVRPFLSIQTWLKETIADSFKKYLILFLCFFGIVIYAIEQYQTETSVSGGEDVSFFFHPLCPHCQKQKEFNAYLQEKYPQLQWVEYDTSIPENAMLLSELLAQNDGNQKSIGVPKTFIGPYLISGFNTKETTGAAIEKAIQDYLKKTPSQDRKNKAERHNQQTVELPVLGEIKLAEYSLFSLAVILGLVDGFNPCAMWVLVYLISLILTLKDRRKIWFLVGTFVGASGILYFLFMTAWLNVFLFLGYLRILTLIIGLTAIGVGLLNIREYLQTKGELACKIGDAAAKQKTMGKIDQIVHAPLTFFTVSGIVVLAFIVNSIEFACSAALPAIFTHALTLNNLPTFHYYGYILIYDFFFMLDDLIIFSLAVLALDTNIGQKYAKYCKAVGGAVLLALGAVMVLAPELLR